MSGGVVLNVGIFNVSARRIFYGILNKVCIINKNNEIYINSAYKLQ